MQGFSPPSTFALSGKHWLAPSRFALRSQQNQRIVFAFSQIDTLENVETADSLFDYPMMIKSRRQAYDGRGNAVPHSKEELASVVAALGGYERGLYAERWTSFTKELSVIVARERDDSILCYPAVETIHIDNICHIVEAPADVPEKIKKLSVVIACRAVNSLKGVGVFVVELFLTQDGQVLLNEVSPRPHNNGHHTIESCYTSQYEQHLRAVLGLLLGETSMKTSTAIMHNILGEDEGEQGFYLAHQLLKRALNISGATVYWYDKPEMRWLQKIGHMIIVGPSRSNVRNHMDVILNRENIESYDSGAPQVAIIMESDSDLPTMKDAADMLSTFHVPFEITIVSAHRTPERMYSFALSAKERGFEIIIAGAGGAAHLPGMVASLTPLPVIGVPIRTFSLDGMDSLLSIVQMPKGIPVSTVAIGNAANAALLAVRMLATKDDELWERLIKYQEELRDTILNKAEKLEGKDFKDMTINFLSSLWIKGYHTDTPQVSIIVGSDSDLPIMKDAAEMLSTFRVPFEITILSAHRTPEIMYSFALSAKERGIEIIIAGDGGATHLPGMVASLTQLPVIGVPIGTSSLYGMSSLWSIVQMPKGIPVATVAIGNAANAALLAVRMLATKDGELWERLIKYQEELRDTILNKAEKLEGFKDMTINYQRSLWIKGYHTDTPQVSIIMGSDSDLTIMKDAAEMLSTFHVPFEITIVSAYRTPGIMYSFSLSAKERGIEIIIAGDGGAAHLPGMVASLTQLPVIGVPIGTPSLDGMHSLWSIVQMPKGMPVATVAIGNATNAALLAVRMLATKDGELWERLIKYQEELRDTILNKAEKLEGEGFKDMTINYQSSLWIKGYHTDTPQVAIIMGSDSDLPTMKDAAEMLNTFHVPFEITIVSAHRTPERMYSFAVSAKERGIEIIIAGAGGAAHLPGMVASFTQLPVIGVPIRTSSLDGVDLLLSIVQMPKGIPVATVAIGNAANAALLAVRILATKDGELLERLIKYQEELRDTILNKTEKLEGEGW